MQLFDWHGLEIGAVPAVEHQSVRRVGKFQIVHPHCVQPSGSEGRQIRPSACDRKSLPSHRHFCWYAVKIYIPFFIAK
jgi:hypothetical protein